MSKIRINFIYSFLLTVSNYIFPLIIFPYVSRVLGVNNIGICNFVDSIINYFILFCNMGIGAVGIREIAKYSNNKNQLNSVFSSLLFLVTISTVIAILILLTCIFLVPEFYEHRKLLFIGVIKLIFNIVLVDWLYKGLEAFRYITLRTIFVKILYVVSIFLFVKNSNDYAIYFSLTCLLAILNSIIDFVLSRKYVSLSFKNTNLKKYLYPFISVGIYVILTSMYTSFNTVYLGIKSEAKEVGYYTTATKLYAILLAVFTAFTGVMLPRMTSLAAEGRMEEFHDKIYKSYNFLFIFTFPLIVFTEIFAPQIIQLIAGPGYEGAILPMRIVMPLLVIIGIEQILIIQVLMPLGKDRAILWNSVMGAVLGLLLNILLVSHLKSVGSALVWVFCEFAVLIGAQTMVSRHSGIKFPFKDFLKQFLLSLPIILMVVLLKKEFLLSTIDFFIIGGTLVVIYYFLLNIFIFKNQIMIQFLDNVRNKLKW